jgi:hypothetical protein
MASLTGNKIKDTYKGIIKTSDNAELSGTAKELTDGNGNGSGVYLDNAGNVSATSFTGDGSGLTNLPSGAVSSVNTQTGAVVLDTDDIGEGSTNQYFTTVRAVNAVTGGNLDMSSYDITTTGKIYFANVFSTEGDLPSASTYHGMFAHVHATGKAYFAHSGSWHKLLDEDSSNTDDLSEGSSNLYYTDARVSANSAVAANTAKTGITTTQADDIVANNAKVTRRPITAGGNTLETSESLTLTAGSNVTITEADGTVTIASSGGASGTDLSNTPAGSTLEIESSSGTNTTIPAATIYLAGVMTGVDKTKLNSIEQNADVTDATNVTAGLVAATGISAGDKSAILTNIGAGSGSGAVDSVNGATGVVVLDTDDIAEGTTNLYYTDARADARVNLQTGSNLDLSSKSTSDLSEGTNLYYTEARVSANTSVAANTAKTSMVLGTTAGTALEGDTALLQLGTTSTTALAGDTTTISAQQASDISTNNAKVGITTQQASDITANNAKVGITTQQASDITANNAKVSMVLGTTAGTALEGDTVIPTNNNQLTNGASYITASSTDTLTNKSGSNSQWTNDENYLTGNETVTLSGDITGSGTTAITASIANNVVGADELNVSGNGTSGQVLASDGDGTFSWADAGGSYTPNIVSGATTASKDNLYIFTASATLTLPASPSGGDSIKVSNLSGTTTCVLARNGSNIMADASDMTLDNQYASFELIYGDATRGWVVVGGN